MNLKHKYKSILKRDEDFYKKEIFLMKDIEWVRCMAEKID